MCFWCLFFYNTSSSSSSFYLVLAHSFLLLLCFRSFLHFYINLFLFATPAFITKLEKEKNFIDWTQSNIKVEIMNLFFSLSSFRRWSFQIQVLFDFSFSFYISRYIDVYYWVFFCVLHLETPATHNDSSTSLFYYFSCYFFFFYFSIPYTLNAMCVYTYIYMFVSMSTYERVHTLFWFFLTLWAIVTIIIIYIYTIQMLFYTTNNNCDDDDDVRWCWKRRRSSISSSSSRC